MSAHAMQHIAPLFTTSDASRPRMSRNRETALFTVHRLQQVEQNSFNDLESLLTNYLRKIGTPPHFTPVRLTTPLFLLN